MARPPESMAAFGNLIESIGDPLPIAFVVAHPLRYVLKFDESYLTSDANYVGMRDDGADVIAIMTRYRQQWRAES